MFNNFFPKIVPFVR